MEPGHAHQALTPTTRIELVKLPDRHGDRWPLLSDYVDLVWTEVLGVTTTAVARRLGHLLGATPPLHGVSLDALATPLTITPAKALDALRRLHHHRIIDFHERAAVIGCSGLVPAVPAARTAILSAYTNRLRLALERRADVLERGPSPGSGGTLPGPTLALDR